MNISILLSALVFSLTPLAGEEMIAGTIEHDSHGKSFVGVNDKININSDPSMLIKGDRLLILGSRKTRGDDLDDVIGRVVVTSVNSATVYGVVKEAYREITLPAYLVYEIGLNEQINRFFPFIKAVANSYLKNPARERLKVAIIDITNQHGRSNETTDRLNKILRNAICHRGQFICVKGNDKNKSVGKAPLLASSGFKYNKSPDHEANVLITGRVKKEAKDIILYAEPTKNNHTKLKPLWFKFEAQGDELEKGN